MPPNHPPSLGHSGGRIGRTKISPAARGGNSQWRTRFRRDYRIGRTYYFNVDGKHDLWNPLSAKDRDGLAREERIELLISRCFIIAKKPHDDLYPYDATYHTVA